MLQHDFIQPMEANVFIKGPAALHSETQTGMHTEADDQSLAALHSETQIEISSCCYTNLGFIEIENSVGAYGHRD